MWRPLGAHSLFTVRHNLCHIRRLAILLMRACNRFRARAAEQKFLRAGSVEPRKQRRSRRRCATRGISLGRILISAQPYPDLTYVRFSNRPLRVKRFQTIHGYSVDVAHGLALLFGLGTKALPSRDSKTRWNNLLGDLAVNVAAGSSGHTNSPHPSSREGHHSTVRRISGFS
jgi:hypothetical protein